MSGPVLLRELNTGVGTPLVAIDFPGARPGADITQLASRGAMPMLELIPPMLAGVSVRPDAVSYARVYADALERGGLTEAHLIGYCAGAMLALELAAELTRRGTIVVSHATLLDPLPIGASFLLFAYEQITRERPDSVLTELTRLVRAGDPLATYTYLADKVSTHHADQCRTIGVDIGDEIARDLLERYRSWLGFIVAASTVRSVSYLGSADVMLSADYGPQAIRLPQWRVRSFPVPQADLLRDPAVRTAVLGRLG